MDNLVMILEEAYPKLDVVDDANLILAIGVTGGGKSTMLTSLVFGPQALELQKTKVEYNVPTRSGEVKKKFRTEYQIS